MKTKRYNVGYGRPPQHTKYRKGQSGNPTGRPSRRKNFRTEIKAVMDGTVTVLQDGKPLEMSKRGILALGLYTKSAKGDLRALKQLTDLLEKHVPEEFQIEKSQKLDAPRREIIDRFFARKFAQGDQQSHSRNPENAGGGARKVRYRRRRLHIRPQETRR